jgi:hypothetical protein
MAGATPDPASETPRRPPRRGAKIFHTGWPLAAIGAMALLSGNPLSSGPGAPPSGPPGANTAVVAAAMPVSATTPVPLVATGQPVDWWVAYKFSASSFPTADDDPGRACPFGGAPQNAAFSLKYAVASSANPVLQDGPGLIGDSNGDPLGATFARIYGGQYYFVVWNDQFYNDPPRHGPACDDKQCGSPWGHSKGLLAWDKTGQGVLLQVTTPSWPGAASADRPRTAGNTLGCVSNDNNVSNAQDFFALKLNRDDVKTVLKALAAASVSTDIANPQIVRRDIGGAALPQDLDALVAALGQISPSKAYMDDTLSTGVRIIVKPSALHVPPWQFVSSVLGGEPLLAATWWASPKIASTRSAADIHCWDDTLTSPPGEVDVAIKGSWDGAPVAFTGGPNHAKVGVSLPSGEHHYAIFGDLNQQGQLGSADAPNGAKCASSQNGRGGMFFIIDNPALHDSFAKLLSGTIAPYPDR